MESHAFSFYCKPDWWAHCDFADLTVVKILKEDFDPQGDCTARDIIYRCARCGGFYRRQYRAIYYSSHLFDTEEGWSVTDKYFKIEEARWKELNSSLDVPLMLEDARFFGYAGEDHTWKNGRCNFPAQNVELTCRAPDLQFIAYREPGARSHLDEKFYKCRRCGQWYIFKIREPYIRALLKLAGDPFSPAAAPLEY